MIESLADAVDALRVPDRGLQFESAGSAPSFVDYRRLREEVHALARKLAALGVRRGDRVVLVDDDQARFVRTFLALIRAGPIVVPVHPPALTGTRDDYVARVERIRRVSGARWVLSGDDLAGRLRSAGIGARAVSWTELSSGRERGELPRIRPDDAALIQFTSGSTGSPRGAELTHRHLATNALAMKRALDIDPGRDRAVSWLPMHHDMGLIGFLVAPVLVQASCWYLEPREFARRPRRWLDLMSRVRASVSSAPNFGYELVSRRVCSAEGADWDLSAWRVAGCGGEPIAPAVLARFAERLRPAGFDARAFVPCYGLAEATLAVSIAPLHRGVLTRRCAADDAGLSGAGSSGAPGSALVSSGRRVDGTEIRVVSPSREPRADGEEGEIEVRGPGVATRFWTDDGPRPATGEDGWLATGDLGVLMDGELHVSGRCKEVMILNGRVCHPHDVEEAASGAGGVARSGLVAFGRPGNGSERLILVVEVKPGGGTDELRRALRREVRRRTGLGVAEVVCVGRGVIGRTTSGKLRRRELRARFLSGELNEEKCGKRRTSNA